MIRWLCILLSSMPLFCRAQFSYFLESNVPVYDQDGNALSLAWAGGLNAANFNTMDLNGDGTEDLVLFDRMAGKVITFVTVENQYTAALEYENLFPAGISNWLLLRDYNCDGKKDVFTGDILGIKVYTNTTGPGEPLTWEQYLFNNGQGESKSTVLLTEGFSSKINLQLQRDDLPSISDVDGDGDLDILNIRYAGHTVEFHQNLSMEKGLPCDSLDFKRVTRAWGNFSECACGVFAYNGESCAPESGGRTKHAGGKSLLALDVNGDAQQELLFSEAECTQLYLLPNEGTTYNPVIESAGSFPQAQSVNMAIFPTPYFEDVDFDGIKDLIATPNIFTKEYFNSNLSRSTWFYKNNGTNGSPVFSLVKENFLQGDMVDVGDNAVPAFADFDGDGDFDMFISSHSSEQFPSAIYLYENTGSASSPSFKLLTNDYLGFSDSYLFNVKIQFADMNSDQTTDLVFTATSFDDNVTSLYYLPNKSGTRLDFSATTLERFAFPVASSDNLCITDVNEDGLPDILAGRREGNLEYWRNTGIPGSLRFESEDENFLGFEASPLRQNPACAVGDFNGDGHADLAVGDQTGHLGIISDFRNANSDVSSLLGSLVFNPILQTYGEQNLGGPIWPAVVNLFNSSKPTLVVGNILGGVHMLRNDEGESLPEEPQLNVYPNPVSREEILNVQPDRRGTLQVLSVLGQHLSPAILLNANEIRQYTLPPLASGLYLLKFTADNKSSVRRLVVR